MACPKRNDNMVKNLMSQNKKKGNTNSKCDKQFPECPAEPNKKNCIGCPFYKK